MTRQLHIICFSVPYPVDYGGAFDVFYKLPALQQAGIAIHLHCFDYGRGTQPELEKYCASVHYYQRYTGHASIANPLPYIVSSRRNEPLLNRLLQDEHPILMEGIHCTYLLTDERFRHRKCFVRLHNIEHRYYAGIARAAPPSFRKLYYYIESRLLKSYERKIAGKAVFLAVTAKDADAFRSATGCSQVHYLPLFLPDQTVDAAEGLGKYCLYHGDLSIDANDAAAAWLIRKVCNKLRTPLVIAGKTPSTKLKILAAKWSNVTIVPDPSEEAMLQLIKDAQLLLLPSSTSTGIKLKLLQSLYHGRHCIVTPPTVDGSGLEATCHIATTANAFTSLIAQLYHTPFTAEEIRLRKVMLGDIFNNARNANTLSGYIWEMPS